MSIVLEALLSAKRDFTKSYPVKRLGVNFVIKPLSDDEIETARKQNTFSDGRGNMVVNENDFSAALIAKACVEPNFADKSLLDHYGAIDAAECVKNAMLPGELLYLVSCVMSTSGFGGQELDFPN